MSQPAADGCSRWAVRLEYHGGPFVGWQRQRVGLSVQSVMEQAASRIAGGDPVACTAAGRTDAGVHARGQVVHLDLPDAGGKLTPSMVRDALNFHMRPHPIAVVQAAIVGRDWNARFCADRRSYLYRILNRAARPALDAGLVWHVKPPLDLDAMRQAALHLLGRHDFTSFRASSCQAKSPVRTLDLLVLTREGEAIELRTEARSFLHHQVRNMVGTLKLVGEGKWSPDQVATALAAHHRSAAGPTAPPDGLALMAVGYPADPFSAAPAG